ncbi:MAG: hypothetical protein ACRCUI_02260, partial [Polymorphobacter sp.]
MRPEARLTHVRRRFVKFSGCVDTLALTRRRLYERQMHIHPLITDTATLAALCTRLAAADFVTV